MERRSSLCMIHTSVCTVQHCTIVKISYSKLHHKTYPWKYFNNLHYLHANLKVLYWYTTHWKHYSHLWHESYNCPELSMANVGTIGSHLPGHAGPSGCSDNWNVRRSETMLFVYKAEYFPFSAQQNIYEYHYCGVPITEDSDKWLPTVRHGS